MFLFLFLYGRGVGRVGLQSSNHMHKTEKRAAAGDAGKFSPSKPWELKKKNVFMVGKAQMLTFLLVSSLFSRIFYLLKAFDCKFKTL